MQAAYHREEADWKERLMSRRRRSPGEERFPGEDRFYGRKEGVEGLCREGVPLSPTTSRPRRRCSM
jgi:hypothetical protein